MPYGLFLAHNLNVLFTLLIGLGILYLYRHRKAAADSGLLPQRW
ncbi:MAG: hypothetical protein ACLT98_04370 [Eggerthellaceae bacterium]